MRIIARIGGFGALLLGVTVCVTSMTWVSGDPLYQFAADGLQQGALDPVRARAVDRRLQHLQDIRTARDITQPGSSRSLAQAAGSHDANLTEVPEDPSLLFGDDVTCLLQPDTTAGEPDFSHPSCVTYYSVCAHLLIFCPVAGNTNR